MPRWGLRLWFSLAKSCVHPQIPAGLCARRDREGVPPFPALGLLPWEQHLHGSLQENHALSELNSTARAEELPGKVVWASAALDKTPARAAGRVNPGRQNKSREPRLPHPHLAQAPFPLSRTELELQHWCSSLRNPCSRGFSGKSAPSSLCQAGMFSCVLTSSHSLFWHSKHWAKTLLGEVLCLHWSVFRPILLPGVTTEVFGTIFIQSRQFHHPPPHATHFLPLQLQMCLSGSALGEAGTGARAQ